MATRRWLTPWSNDDDPICAFARRVAVATAGRNATSISVLSINYPATQRVQLCLGALVPNPGSQNRAGVVFELNLLGYDAEDDAPPGGH